MNVLVIYCHPSPGSLVEAAKDRVMAGLARAAHDARLIDLYADGFDPAMSADERRTHKEPGVAPELQPYVDDLQWAEALVFVYPTWWSGQPAMLKGWFDRVWVSGVAWTARDDGELRPLLTNVRRILIVTTHGSSKLINALEGETGKRTIVRSMRAMCNWRTRTKWCALYSVDTKPEEHRTAFLRRVEHLAAKL